MRKIHYYKKLILLFLLLSVFLSCDDNIEFTQTKETVLQTKSNILKVESYKLRFNPKGKGTIIFTLENQEEYTATNLSSSQLSSLLQLAGNTNLEFDKLNKEFVLN